MRKIIAILICTTLIATLATPAFAANSPQVISSERIELDNGITVIDEVIKESSSRATDATYTRRRTFDDDGTVIAVIAFRATFRYDGSTVSVVSKSVTQTDTYEGWSYTQNSFTSSGGTVTLSGKLSKLLIINSSFTMSMTCDKNGNISY